MKYYALMSALPELPQHPEPLPFALTQLIDDLKLHLSTGDWEIARALLMRLDVANIEAHGSGWQTAMDARALWNVQALSPQLEDMPWRLARFLDQGQDKDYDQLWKAYYTYLLEEVSPRSDFVSEWLSWEIPLLNALVKARTGLWEISEVLLEEPPGAVDHSALISQWAEAPNPMAKQYLLDQARLDLFDQLSGLDPFDASAVFAYLSAALVLDRWTFSSQISIQNIQTLLEEFL